MNKLFCALVFVLAVSLCKASIENEFKTAYNQIVDDIDYKVEHLKELVGTTIEQNKKKLVEIGEEAVNSLDLDSTLDEACKQTIKSKIESFTNNSFINFFKCSNLTDALVETGSIIVTSLELTANLTSNADAIFGRLSKCSSEEFYEVPLCWLRAVLDLKTDVENDMDDVSTFKSRVTKLGIAIKNNIEYCVNPPKKNLIDAIHHVLLNTKNCKSVSS